MGEVAEAERGAAEVLEPAVDGLGGAVAGAGAVEEREDVRGLSTTLENEAIATAWIPGIVNRPGSLPLLCGCQRRLGWCFEVSVVRGLVLVGRDVAEGGVQASGVVPVNPSSGDPFDVVDGAQWAGAER